MFHDADTARSYLESRRWPNGVRCPVCDSDRIGQHSPGFWRCNACKEAFTVQTGTVMERSHVPLRGWLMAMILIAADPETSSESIARAIGVTQKTGWKMQRRIHDAAGDFLAQSFARDDADHRVIADAVLTFRPKAKSKPARKRARRRNKIQRKSSI